MLVRTNSCCRSEQQVAGMVFATVALEPIVAEGAHSLEQTNSSSTRGSSSLVRFVRWLILNLFQCLMRMLVHASNSSTRTSKRLARSVSWLILCSLSLIVRKDRCVG